MSSTSALKKAKSAKIPQFCVTPMAPDCHSTNGCHLGQIFSTSQKNGKTRAFKGVLCQAWWHCHWGRREDFLTDVELGAPEPSGHQT